LADIAFNVADDLSPDDDTEGRRPLGISTWIPQRRVRRAIGAREGLVGA
jgi:hypothetical protein